LVGSLVCAFAVTVKRLIIAVVIANMASAKENLEIDLV
jgi:hypothetical protein